MQFLSWAYVEGTSAYGENTSLYNWCEMDFYISPYIAEFMNTLTNIDYILLAIKGINNNRRNNNDVVINICYAMLAFVGIGSAIYHANPKYFSQMIDEASMLYATTAILYGALSITLGGTARKGLAVLLFGLVVTMSIVHCFLGHVKAFRLCFLTMIVSVTCQCVFLILTKVPDVKVKRNARSLAIYGSATFVIGFIYWNIDRRYCGHLSSARDIVGMPLGFLTEFHGWWHIFTGIGVYYFIVFIEYLRLYIAASSTSHHPRMNLIWKSVFSLPRIETIQKEGSKKS